MSATLVQSAEAALAAASRVEHADARVTWLEERRVELTDRDFDDEVHERGGTCVRALRGAGWGVAGDRAISEGAAAAAMERAVDAAQPGSVRLAERDAERGHHDTPVDVDPFAVEAGRLRRDFAPVLEAGSGRARLRLSWIRITEVYADGAGTRVTQRLSTAAASLSVGSGEQRLGTEIVSAGGYEAMDPATLTGELAGLVELASALPVAPPCPAAPGAIVLTPERAGRAALGLLARADADRALAGDASALPPQRQGRLVLAPPLVDIAVDASAPGLAGTCGWDDEGVATHPTPCVSRGVFVGYMSSRESAGALDLGRSAGCMRAAAPELAPAIRPHNAIVRPATAGAELDELVADTGEGVLLGTHAAWEIHRGRRGRLLRPAEPEGDPWPRCDAIGGRASRHGLVLDTADGQLPVGLSAPPVRLRGARLRPK